MIDFQDHLKVTKQVNDKTDHATLLLVYLKYKHSFKRELDILGKQHNLDDRHYELAEVVILRQIG